MYQIEIFQTPTLKNVRRCANTTVNDVCPIPYQCNIFYNEIHTFLIVRPNRRCATLNIHGSPFVSCLRQQHRHLAFGLVHPLCSTHVLNYDPSQPILGSQCVGVPLNGASVAVVAVVAVFVERHCPTIDKCLGIGLLFFHIKYVHCLWHTISSNLFEFATQVLSNLQPQPCHGFLKFAAQTLYPIKHWCCLASFYCCLPVPCSNNCRQMNRHDQDHHCFDLEHQSVSNHHADQRRCTWIFFDCAIENGRLPCNKLML